MLRRALFLALLLGAVALALLLAKWHTTSNQGPKAENPPIARVYNQYLYKSDLAHLGEEVVNFDERSEIVDHYIQNWVSKRLLIAEAEANSMQKKADIEQRVLEYRYALLVHGFIEKLVNAQLNKEVSEEEILAYYQENQESFALRYNIFKGKFVVLPKNRPNGVKLRSLLVAEKSEKSQVALKKYCLQFAKDYALDDTVWLQWEELIKATPFSKVRDKAKLLKKGVLLQTSDDEYFYYFKVEDFRLVNDVSPLEFVRNQIMDIIIYKRKIDLANKIKKDILQKSKNSNNCAVYDH